jgi:hypothetical protein
MGVMILVTGLFIASMLGQLSAILQSMSFFVRSGLLISTAMLGELIRLAGLLYVVAIFLRLFLPFFGFGYTNNFFPLSVSHHRAAAQAVAPFSGLRHV